MLFCSAAAAQPVLQLPVDCSGIGGCPIQYFPDRVDGPGHSDFACQTLSYDGHKGTDFRLRRLTDLSLKVEVLAAASGQVVAIRDGMQEALQGTPFAPDVTGRECGNGVLIAHPGGWETQYCHLARGSISVVRGQDVAAGTPLGHIGLSGHTSFPHLHFQIRQSELGYVDPFDGQPLSRAKAVCGDTTGSLWAAPPDHVAGGLLAAGLYERLPSFDEVRSTGPTFDASAARTVPALVVWGHFFGVQLGDEIVLELLSPDGSTLAKDIHVLTRDRAVEYRGVGRKRPPLDWAPGTYLGRVGLVRDGRNLVAETVSVTLR